MIINDKIYTNESHYSCVQDFNEDFYPNDDDDGLDSAEIDDRHRKNTNYENISYICGHVIESKKSIFLETKTIKNMSMDEALYILQKEYPDYQFYDDDSYGEESFDGDNLSKEDDARLYKKIAKKKLISNLDQNNRDYAIVIINGKVYTGSSHYKCVEDSDLTSDELDPDNVDDRYFMNNYANSNSCVCGHVVGKLIFLELDSLENMSLNDAIDILKLKYPNYDIYDNDNDDYIGNILDVSNPGYYIRLAKMIINADKPFNIIWQNPPKEGLDEGYEGWDAGSYDVTCWQNGFVDVNTIKDIPGKNGENRRNWERKNGTKMFGNYTEEEWAKFLEDIKQNGIKEEIFIVVEKTGEVLVYEGNHRIQAALQLNIQWVPVEIRYFGNIQKKIKF